MNKMIKASDLYRLAKGLLEPGEEHLNPEYARALVELLVDVEGFDMTKKSLVARRLGIPKKHVPTICR